VGLLGLEWAFTCSHAPKNFDEIIVFVFVVIFIIHDSGGGWAGYEGGL
jgi:hypothetical protein